VRAAITERERQIVEIVTQVAGRKKNSVRNQVKNLRKFVESSMGQMRELLVGHASPGTLRMELSKHLKEIILLPDGEGKSIRYSGAWKLLGQNTGGAEGES
jgi:hypothetical protein